MWPQKSHFFLPFCSRYTRFVCRSWFVHNRCWLVYNRCRFVYNRCRCWFVSWSSSNRHRFAHFYSRLFRFSSFDNRCRCRFDISWSWIRRGRCWDISRCFRIGGLSVVCNLGGITYISMITVVEILGVSVEI